MSRLFSRLAMATALVWLIETGGLCGQSLFVTTQDEKEKQSELPKPRELPEKGEGKDPEISLAPPNAEQLFQVQSEQNLLAQIRKEAQDKKIKVSFPEGAKATTEQNAFPGRHPQQASFVHASVCHCPLYFEDKNSERYGWCLPHVQPLLSAGRFYLQSMIFPSHFLVRPPWEMECSDGLPLPGDPVPYSIYLGPGNWALTIDSRGGNHCVRP